MTCEKCGVHIAVGEWPFCPHGPIRADPYRATTFADSIPGGLTLENYGPHPVTVYSHTERKTLMASRGLELRERWAPLPGTDRDPQGVMPTGRYIDPQTLENARTLLCRQSTGPVQEASYDAAIRPFNLVGTTEDAKHILSIIEPDGRP